MILLELYERYPVCYQIVYSVCSFRDGFPVGYAYRRFFGKNQIVRVQGLSKELYAVSIIQVGIRIEAPLSPVPITASRLKLIL